MIRVNGAARQVHHYEINGVSFGRDPQTGNVMLVFMTSDREAHVLELDKVSDDELFASYTKARTGVIMPDGNEKQSLRAVK